MPFKKKLYNFITCETDKSFFKFSSTLKNNVQNKILSLRIFNEKTLNKANDENSAAQLYIDGPSGLSLNTIINTKQEDLEERIFEINTDDYRDEDAS